MNRKPIDKIISQIDGEYIPAMCMEYGCRNVAIPHGGGMCLHHAMRSEPKPGVSVYHGGYQGPVIMVTGVSAEEEIAVRCERAGLSNAYKEPETLGPVPEPETPLWLEVFCMAAFVFAVILVWGIAHGLPLPAILGGK